MRWLILLLVLVLALGACGAPGPAPVVHGAVPPDQVEGYLVRANADFGMRLFKAVAREAGTANIFLSPTSIALALHMTYNGSAGETREAMAQALGLHGVSPDDLNRANAELLELLASADPKVQLAIGNSLWANRDIVFNPTFLDRVRSSYQAEVNTLDFADPAAPDAINGWVEQKTSGMINQIVGEIPPDTILYLINAIYFKGTWTKEFAPQLTREQPFTLPDGSTAMCQTMVSTDLYRYLKRDGFRAVALPYGAGQVSMYLFLPDEGRSLNDFVAGLDGQRWTEWMAGFQEAKKVVKLPRFKLEYEVTLNDTLKALGMGPAFEPAQADFSALLDQPSYISEVLHKSVVEVNEEGTEAAAVTSVRAVVLSANTEQIEVVGFDRPFFFAIRDDKTGALLFMGTVADPQ